jgi:hypothetical protein
MISIIPKQASLLRQNLVLSSVEKNEARKCPRKAAIFLNFFYLSMSYAFWRGEGFLTIAKKA